MGKKKKKLPLLEKVEILDAGSEGKAVGRVDDKVVFVPYVVPGDVADVKVHKKRNSYMEGMAVKIHQHSEKRVEPKCEHFGICGGCKWQNMNYEDQLFYKQKQVKETLKRLGKFEMPDVLPIIPSENIYYYRNKLEFTFSNKKWLTDFRKEINFDDLNMNGLGFHIPKMYNRILDLNNCYLQPEPSNSIRLAVNKYANEHHLDYYDVNTHSGFLRNLIIRNTVTGELMVILVFNYFDEQKINDLLGYIASEFPAINSLMYVVNEKMNDIITDLKVSLFKGNPFITEEMEGLKFKIGPVSFYQTNSLQAYELYKVARDFAQFKGDEVVFDLYTGIGTIANFIASGVKRVFGMEYVESAINDAIDNSRLNNISNTEFFAGDISNILNNDFVKKNGKPDVIITDPPRNGMHEKVVNEILAIEPERIIYVSCNPATQARDVSILNEKYAVEKIQPVDMFPHTHHLENVMLLVKK